MLNKTDRAVLRRLNNRLEIIRESINELDFEGLSDIDLTMAQLQEQIEDVIYSEDEE